jgi:hypothetical protein
MATDKHTGTFPHSLSHNIKKTFPASSCLLLISVERHSLFQFVCFSLFSFNPFLFIYFFSSSCAFFLSPVVSLSLFLFQYIRAEVKKLIVVFWVVTQCGHTEDYISLKKEAIRSPETTVTTYKTAWCHDPGYGY